MPPPESSADASVVIPVLNAARWLPDLLQALHRQTPPSRETILVDSGSTDRTVDIASAWGTVRVLRLDRFSHGYARNAGAQAATGRWVVFLSQDALPQNEHWLERLLAPFTDPQVAATYSRQVPRPDASPMERFFLHTHFPPGDRIRRVKVPGRPLGLADVFFSNVSAAVRRQCLLEHPFDESLIMSEDQQLSRDLLEAGYAVVYVPDSLVVHSHRYSLAQCFRRYFDSLYSLTCIFPHHDLRQSVSMGAGYWWREARYVARHAPLWLPYYALYSMAKAAGVLAGHAAERLPRRLARVLSFHPNYWDPPAGS